MRKKTFFLFVFLVSIFVIQPVFSQGLIVFDKNTKAENLTEIIKSQSPIFEKLLLRMEDGDRVESKKLWLKLGSVFKAHVFLDKYMNDLVELSDMVSIIQEQKLEGKIAPKVRSALRVMSESATLKNKITKRGATKVMTLFALRHKETECVNDLFCVKSGFYSVHGPLIQSKINKVMKVFDEVEPKVLKILKGEDA